MSRSTSYVDYYKAKDHALRQHSLLELVLTSLLEKGPEHKNASLLFATLIDHLDAEINEQKLELSRLPTADRLDTFKQEELTTLTTQGENLKKIIEQQEKELTISSGSKQKEHYSTESFKKAIVSQPPIIADVDTIKSIDIKSHFECVNKQLCDVISLTLYIPHEQSNPSYQRWRDIYDIINNNLHTSHYKLLSDGFSAYGDDAQSATTLIFNQLNGLFYPGETLQPKDWLDKYYIAPILAPLCEREALIGKLYRQTKERTNGLESYARNNINKINGLIDNYNKLINQIEANNVLITFTNDDTVKKFFQKECSTDAKELPKNQNNITALIDKTTKLIDKIFKETLPTSLKNYFNNNSADPFKKLDELKYICNLLHDSYNAMPEHSRKNHNLKQLLENEITNCYQNFFTPFVQEDIDFLKSCISFSASTTATPSVYCNKEAQKILENAEEKFSDTKRSYEALKLPKDTKIANPEALFNQTNTVKELNKKTVDYCNSQIKHLKKNRSLARSIADNIRTFFRHIAYFFDRGQYVNSQHVKIQPQSRHEKAEYCLSSAARFFSQPKPSTQQKTIPTHGTSRRLH